jgi:hypothetical protein
MLPELPATEQKERRRRPPGDPWVAGRVHHVVGHGARAEDNPDRSPQTLSKGAAKNQVLRGLERDRAQGAALGAEN